MLRNRVVTCSIVAFVGTLVGCHTKDPYDPVADYSARLENAARAGSEIPRIPDDLKAKAAHDAPNAQSELENKRRKAQDESKKITEQHTKQDVDKCLANLDPPTSGDDPGQTQRFANTLTDCKKAEQEVIKPGFGNDQAAFKDFLRWAEFVGALAAIGSGNYPLAAILLSGAMADGRPSENASSGASPNSTLNVADSSSAASKETTASGNSTEVPSGWSALGTSTSGVTVAHSPNFSQLSFQEPGLPRVVVSLTSDQSGRLSKADLSACTDLHVDLSILKVELFLQNRNATSQNACPNLVLTYDPTSGTSTLNNAAEASKKPD